LGCTVAEAQSRISSREFAEWLAYDRLEPIGAVRDDWNAALVAQTVAGIFAGRGHRPRLADFVLRWDRGEQRSAEEIKAGLSTWLAKKRKKGN